MERKEDVEQDQDGHWRHSKRPASETPTLWKLAEQYPRNVVRVIANS
jgi:hypothetical protein